MALPVLVVVVVLAVDGDDWWWWGSRGKTCALRVGLDGVFFPSNRSPGWGAGRKSRGDWKGLCGGPRCGEEVTLDMDGWKCSKLQTSGYKHSPGASPSRANGARSSRKKEAGAEASLTRVGVARISSVRCSEGVWLGVKAKPGSRPPDLEMLEKNVGQAWIS